MSFPLIENEVGERWDVHLTAPITAPEASALVFYCENSSQNYEKGKCYLLPCALALSQFRCVIAVYNTNEIISIPFLSIAKWKVSRATHHVMHQLQTLISATIFAQHDQNNQNNNIITNVHNTSVIQQQQPSSSFQSSAYVLTLHTKHVFTYHILIQREMIVRNIKSTLSRCSSIATVQEMPAFQYYTNLKQSHVNRVLSNATEATSTSSRSTSNNTYHNNNNDDDDDTTIDLQTLFETEEFGWNIYSPEVEYARQLNRSFLLLQPNQSQYNFNTDNNSSESAKSDQSHLEEWVAELEQSQENNREVEKTQEQQSLLLELEQVMRQNQIELLTVANYNNNNNNNNNSLAISSDTKQVRADKRHDFHLISLYQTDNNNNNNMISQIPLSLSPTYPRYLLQPRSITLQQVIIDLTARSRGRVLALSFVHGCNGALLIRAAQPLLRSNNVSLDSVMCREYLKRSFEAALSHSGTTEVNKTAKERTPHRYEGDVESETMHSSSLYATKPSILPAATAPPAPSLHHHSPPPSLFDEDDNNSNNGNNNNNTITNKSTTAQKASSSPSPSAISQQPLEQEQQEEEEEEEEQTQYKGPSMESTPSATTSNKPASTLFVADCRPALAANANAQLGGGFESGSCYSFARLFFYNIDNIFAVKKSLVKVRELIREYGVESEREDFYKELHSSKWLTHMQHILKCANDVAHVMQHNNESALVHCTDGWDRTAQVICVVMILLDPFYRTLVGFATLVEKEFVQFGHKLAERNEMQIQGRGVDASMIAEYNKQHSHNSSNSNRELSINMQIQLTAVDRSANVVSADTESSNNQHNSNNSNNNNNSTLQDSPIFLQFLDVVFQLVHQFPNEFEFNAHLLSYLAQAAYSGIFGTFLCNSDYERLIEGVKLNTCSVWTHILRRAALEKKGVAAPFYVNPHYNASRAWKWISHRELSSFTTADNDNLNNNNYNNNNNSNSSSNMINRKINMTPSPLLPVNINSSKLVFWSEFYFHHDYFAFTNSLSQSDNNNNNNQKEVDGKWPVISWGREFDNYLDRFIYLACVQRHKEQKELAQIEKLIVDMLQSSNSSNYNSNRGANNNMIRKTSNSSSSKENDKKVNVFGNSNINVKKSKWCEFDSTVCYNCYKPFSLWAGKTMCAGCKQMICSNCVEHECTM